MKHLVSSSTLVVGLLVVAVAALPFLPLMRGVPAAHDLPDHLAMATEYLEGLKEGVLLPRWYGSFNFGWGEPTGVFYPPALYSLTAFLSRFTGGDVLSALLAALLVMTLVGMAGIYLLARPLAGRPAALVACAFYVLMPFRSFELYAAGLFSAYAAGSVLPWVLLSLWRIASPGPRRNLLGATLAWALTYALVILFNLPAALLTTYLVAIWVLLELVVSRSWQRMACVVAGGAWGALMAAVYLLPAVRELPLIVVPHSDGEPLHGANYIFQGAGSWMAPGLKSLFNRMGGLPALLFFLAALVLLRRLRQRGGEDLGVAPAAAPWLRLVATFGVAALFLATPLSAAIWDTFPFLRRVNMPWRLLDHFAVPAAALSAVALGGFLRSGDWLSWIPRLGGLTTFAFLAFLCLELDSGIFTMNGTMATDSAPALVQNFYHRQGYFLPQGAAPSSPTDDHPLIHVQTPGTRAEILEWSSSRRRLRVVSDVPGRLALRTYYYPGWTARLEPGERDPVDQGPRQEDPPAGAVSPLALRGEPGTGRMILEVPPGEHEVVLSFENTLVRDSGEILTLLSGGTWGALLLRFLLLRRRRHERQ